MRSFIAIHDKGKKPVIPMDKIDLVVCKKLNDDGYGIYGTVNEFEATKQQMLEAGAKTIRNNKFCTKINGVYADLDIAKSGDNMAEAERERKKKELIVVLNNHYPPNLIIVTKNGLQPIWYLSDTSPKNAERAVNVINGIIEWSKLFGAAGDDVKDIARVLRIPGFYHHKSEPYLITKIAQHDEKFSYEELEEQFPFSPKEKYVEQPINNDFREIDSVDFRALIVRAYSKAGVNASFDKQGRVIENGRLTGTFQGKNGDRRYLASSSHDPKVGNAITAVADILKVNNKEAYKWIVEEFNLKPSKQISRKDVKKSLIETKKRDVLKQFYQKQEENYLTWGVGSLDKTFHKPEPANYILFLGTPGIGKTSFCLFMALENAKAGIKTLFISLEMTKEAVEERYIEIYAGITEQDRVKAEYGYDQERKMKECKKELENENFTMVDSDDIGARIDKDILETLIEDYDLIFLDNLSFMTKRDEKFYVAQAQASEEIVKLVNTTGKTLIVLHHMKKDRESMAGSQKLEDDCSVRIDMFQNKDEEDKSKMNLVVRKNRRRNKGSSIVFFRNAKYIGNWDEPTDFNQINNLFK